MDGALGKRDYHGEGRERERETNFIYFCNWVVFVKSRISHFASMYSKKLGIREHILNRTLWGDYYLNTKTKRIHKGAYVSSCYTLYMYMCGLSSVSLYFDRKKEKSHYLFNLCLTTFGRYTSLFLTGTYRSHCMLLCHQ